MLGTPSWTLPPRRCNVAEAVSGAAAESSGGRGRRAEAGIWQPPAPADLARSVRNFLGVYCVKELDVVNFLESAGALAPQVGSCKVGDSVDWNHKHDWGLGLAETGLTRLPVMSG